MSSVNPASDPTGTRSKPRGLDIAFAVAGIAPFVICALMALDDQSRLIILAQTACTTYGGALICFLGGVRRGLSFRQPGGPTVPQLVTMAGLLFMGLAILCTPWRAAALLLLALALAGVLVLDVLASRHGEAPGYFRVLRPIQMTIAIAGVLITMARSAAL